MVTDAAYFDQWYADIDRSARRQQIFTEVLGLPAEIGPSNLVPMEGLAELVAALRLPADGLLVDVACGRGGPGMWIARAAGVRLVGVDFSPVAVSQAEERSGLFGMAESASFQVGELTATGLPSGAADAVVCIDAFQFAPDSAAEFVRVVKPGGRIVLTCWEPKERGDDALPERLRTLDVASALTAAGAVEVVRELKPAWRAAERRLWDRAAATPADGDPAMDSMHDEATRTLATWDRIDRVMITATSPTPS